MSLNVGHLVGYLELDDKKFNRSAAAADKKMTALQLHLKALAATNPKIQIDVETRKLDDLKARMADLKAQAAKGVDVRVEIAQALIEIDRVQLKLRELHNREVKIDVDNRSALSKLGAVGSKINGLWASVLGLGPMLVPVSAAAAGGILAIGSASVAAAAGVGVLAGAFAGMGKATQALAKYREAVDQAGPKAKIQREQLALGVAQARKAVAQAGPREKIQTQQLALGVATAQKAYGKNPTALNAQRLQIAKARQAQGPASSLAAQKLQIALEKQRLGPQSLITAKNTLENSDYGDQTKAGRRFAAFTLDKLKPATSRLHASAQSAVLPGVERGLKSILPLVPLFDRLITHVGHSLGDMAVRAGKALNDPFWRHWFQWISQTAGPTLTIMGHTFGMFVEGLARTLQRFGPQGHSLVLWVDALATKFNAWSQGGSGSSFQRFMDYIAQAGPEVIGVLKPLGLIVGQLLAGMSASGMSELHVFGLLLSGIAHLPTGAIQMIGATLPLIVLSLKGMQVITAVANGLKLFGSAMSALPGQVARGAAGMSSAKATMSGLGLTAGVGLVAAGVHTKNKGLGYAESIGGGALTGASIGSVVPGIGTAAGAGIGAVIGGLARLAAQVSATKTAAQQGATAWHDYAATLDQVSGATTVATRAKALQNASDSGLLKTTRSLGIHDAQVVNALVNGGKARTQVIAAVKGEVSAVGASIAAKKKELAANIAIANDMSIPLAQQTAAANRVKTNRKELDDLENLKKARQKDADTVLSNIGALQKGVAETQRNAAAVNDLTGKLKGIPAWKRTQIKAEGILPTLSGIAALSEKYRLTPAQVRTIVAASGVTFTQGQIDNLVSSVEAYNRMHPKPKIDADTKPARDKISALTKDIGNLMTGNFAALFGGAGPVAHAMHGVGASNPSKPRAPHRAGGGPVAAAHAYQVNEFGPEIFIPSMSGRIVSNHNSREAFSGSGGPSQLYGDVYLQPHNYNEFRGEMEADRRRAATSGVRGGRR